MRQCMMRSFLAIAVLLLFVVGCSGGKGDEQKSATETPAAAPTLEGASRDVFGFLAQALNATFKVSYQTTSAAGAPADTYVIYNKPPMTRIDIIAANSNTPSSIVIGGNKNTRTTSCSGGPGAWKCAEIAPLGDSLLAAAGPFSFLTAAELVSYQVTEIERRTIAGQEARCFKLQPKPPDEEPREYCFNSDGVPLYSSPLFGIVQAVEFSTQVAADDFAPPAEPQ